jgi:hypothetical protein
MFLLGSTSLDAIIRFSVAKEKKEALLDYKEEQ